MVCKCTHTSVVESCSPLSQVWVENWLSAAELGFCVLMCQLPSTFSLLFFPQWAGLSCTSCVWLSSAVQGQHWPFTYGIPDTSETFARSCRSVSLISYIVSRHFSWRVVSRDTPTLAVADISPLYAVHCTSLWQMCYFRCLPSDKQYSLFSHHATGLDSSFLKYFYSLWALSLETGLPAVNFDKHCVSFVTVTL